MKNFVKRCIYSVVYMVVALVIGKDSAQAAEVKQVNIEGYQIIENGMQIYLNGDEDVLRNKEGLEIVLGDMVYSADSVTSFEETKEGVSYLVLVDVSGSVTKQDIEDTKDILTHLVKLKGEEDNLAVLEIRNEIVKTNFQTDEDALLTQVQNIERTSEDTNLYLAVREGLKILSEDKACHQKKCLIIISDGMDDQKNGIIFEDVRDAIKSENIPICTLATPWRGGNVNGENAPDKVMKSFTENAAGGVHIRYEDSELDNEAIADVISQFAHSGVVAEISITDFVSNGSDMTLRVDAQAEGDVVQGDSCSVPSHEIAAAIKQQPTEVVTETEVEVENPEEDPEEKQERMDKWIYLLILALGVLVVAVVGIVVYKKKEATKKSEIFTEDAGQEISGQKESYQENGQELESAEAEAMATVENNSNQMDYDVETPTRDGRGATEGFATERAEALPKVLLLTLTEIGPKATRVLTAEFEDVLTVGRRKTADLVIADDNQVSGMHCELRKDGVKLFLKDLDSTNGTFLNGIPVVEEVQVCQEDTLYIGAYEYRISWD